MNGHSTRALGGLALVAVLLTTSAKAGAPSGRYLIGDGTVLDTKTKLTWERTPGTNPCPPASAGMKASWADAKVYCQNLGSSLGGTGWRLPTMKELQTIVDYKRSLAVLIDPEAFPATPRTWFWSSSPVSGTPPRAWYVNFLDGGTNITGTTGILNVRCVR
jgi:hypothetical protein